MAETFAASARSRLTLLRLKHGDARSANNLKHAIGRKRANEHKGARNERRASASTKSHSARRAKACLSSCCTVRPATGVNGVRSRGASPAGTARSPSTCRATAGRARARGTAPSLAQIAASLRPLIVRETPVHLVGHSFGGAVALKAAAMFPGHVRSLTLIEPAAFNTLWTEHGPDRPESWRFRAAIRSSAAALAEGDAWDAMRHVVDFWNGEGAWERTSFGLRQTLAAQAGQVHDDYAAVEADRTTHRDLADRGLPGAEPARRGLACRHRAPSPTTCGARCPSSGTRRSRAPGTCCR